jgi:itaconate CoA-transferase
MPRVYGSLAQLHVSEVEAIVENNVPLLELPVRASGPEDAVIGKMIAEMVPDGACLQMGVGALPDLVCSQLRSRKDLGIRTEALCPGMIDLIDAGVVTNRRKRLNPGKTVFTFAMGQKAMYDFLDNNPSVESHPVDYVNDPFIIAQNDNVISVNAALQIDLTGEVNAEHMLGHQYSATGANSTSCVAPTPPGAASRSSPTTRPRPRARCRASSPGWTARRLRRAWTRTSWSRNSAGRTSKASHRRNAPKH